MIDVTAICRCDSGLMHDYFHRGEGCCSILAPHLAASFLANRAISLLRCCHLRPFSLVRFSCLSSCASYFIPPTRIAQQIRNHKLFTIDDPVSPNPPTSTRASQIHNPANISMQHPPHPDIRQKRPLFTITVLDHPGFPIPHAHLQPLLTPVTPAANPLVARSPRSPP